MFTRFDHVVLGVRDLADATAAFSAAGFSVSQGGRHTGRGTCNAIVKFGLDYLELLSVYDVDEAIAAGLNGQFLVPFIARRPGGLLGYALATDRIDDLAEQFERTSLEAKGPFPVKRVLPDGGRFDWRLLVPGGGSFRKPWPTVIQWDTSDAERLRAEPPLTHRNGAVRVRGISLVVPDLEGSRLLYEKQLGLRDGVASHSEAFNATQVRYSIGDFTIDVRQPLGAGPLQEALDRDGVGLFQTDLTTTDPGWARSLPGAETAPESSAGVLLPLELTMGARIALFG